MINWKISWFVLGLNVWLTHSIVYVTLQSIFCYFNLCGWAKCWILIGLLIDVASNLITLIDENMETRANSFLFTQAWNYLAIHNEYSNAFWHQVALIGILLFSSLIADFVIRFRKTRDWWLLESLNVNTEMVFCSLGFGRMILVKLTVCN